MSVLSQAGKGEEISRDGLGRGRGRGRGREEAEEEEEGLIECVEWKWRTWTKDSERLCIWETMLTGEKMTEKVGVENMNTLVEALEEMSSKIECEPEYLMEEFGTNPDIDEKPPIPLRDALEKMKPFLMAYEGIQSQEEWEEAISEVMEGVSLLKEIVDHYSGPDSVTAKQQQEELERVAKTIPKKAPASLKRFANRAVLSLQSNPGWGFDKKCQFMDKLVWEASQQYK